MKNAVLLIAALAIAFALGYYFDSVFGSERENSVKEEASEEQIVRPIVAGIGGIFFKCNDATKLKDWYKKYLGFNTNDYGTRFEWVEGPDSSRMGSLQWSPFEETAAYFTPSTKEFMINYRVNDLENLVAKLKTEGIVFLDTVATYPYGKFIHLMDIDSNKLELFEPNFEYGK
jgi:hypothetical protein